MNVPNVVGASINPAGMHYKDIKIGDMVPIEMTAWHWIEIASTMHEHFKGNQMPVLLQQLAAKVFEAMTPEDYRKAMEAELHEAQAKMYAGTPYADLLGMQQVSAEDFEDGEPSD